MSKKSSAAFKPNITRHIQNIVVFMPSFLGDSVNCTPALQLLRQQYPEAKIYLLIRDIANVFHSDPSLHCIADKRHKAKLPGVIDLIKTLRQTPFDACILMTNRFVDAFIAKMAGIPIRIGYKMEMRGPLLTHGLKMDRNRHYINRYAYLANVLCNNSHKSLPPVSIDFDQDKKFLTGRSGLKIGLCILSKHKLTRHYPPEKTAQVIVQLDSAVDEAHYFMLGSPVETNEAEAVVKLSQQQGVQTIESLAGKTTIGELVDIVASLDLLITVDSAVLHVAGAAKTPVVALHSKGTSPFSLICPKNAIIKVVHSRGGYIFDNDQVLDLEPEDIVAAALKLLKRA